MNMTSVSVISLHRATINLLNSLKLSFNKYADARQYIVKIAKSNCCVFDTKEVTLNAQVLMLRISKPVILLNAKPLSQRFGSKR